MTNTVGCLGYVCDGPLCLTACVNDNDCSPGYGCVASECVPVSEQGVPCTADEQCESRHCVDSVCCESECTGQCEWCNAPGTAGACVPTDGEPKGGRLPCAGEQDCAGSCNGVDTGACTFPDATVVCGPAVCEDGEAVAVSLCGGDGTCSPGVSTVCAPYACGVADCLTACTGPSDCAVGSVCTAGVCVPASDAGPHDAGIDAAVEDAGAVSPRFDAAPPEDAAAQVTEPRNDDGGGCGCQVPGPAASGRVAPWMSLMLLAFFGLRRRLYPN